MRSVSLIFVLGIGVIALASFFLLRGEGTRGVLPSPLYPVEKVSPLEITAHSGGTSDYKIPVTFEIKNVSNKNLVLPAFAYGWPGARFSSSSYWARKPDYFVGGGGQIDWVVLKPNEVVKGYEDVSKDLVFLATGRYNLAYLLMVNYSYAKEGHESATKQAIIEAYRQAEFTAMRRGEGRGGGDHHGESG